MVSGWHFFVPVIDDVTDVLLLWQTWQKAPAALWWACFSAAVLADADRVYVLLYVLVSSTLLPFVALFEYLPFDAPLVFLDLLVRCLTSLNCGQDIDYASDGLIWLVLDGISWALLGSRARSTDLMSSVGLAGDAPAREAADAGLGLRAIDRLVHYHPFRYLGEMIFRYPYGHRIRGHQNGSETRRAEVMVRAVGETLVVDPLFLVLGILTSGWGDNSSGLSGISAIFSILELVTELQYYITTASSFMEEPREEGSPKMSELVRRTASSAECSSMGESIHIHVVDSPPGGAHYSAPLSAPLSNATPQIRAPRSTSTSRHSFFATPL